jgi:hypothetical protein
MADEYRASFKTLHLIFKDKKLHTWFKFFNEWTKKKIYIFQGTRCFNIFFKQKAFVPPIAIFWSQWMQCTLLLVLPLSFAKTHWVGTTLTKVKELVWAATLTISTGIAITNLCETFFLIVSLVSVFRWPLRSKFWFFSENAIYFQKHSDMDLHCWNHMRCSFKFLVRSYYFFHLSFVKTNLFVLGSLML